MTKKTAQSPGPRETDLRERLLTAWTEVNALLKDSRMTKGFTYNEAVVMKLVFDRYRQDGVGLVPLRELRQRTNMLKSLLHRTVYALCTRGYLVKEACGGDARAVCVRPAPERLADFIPVHERSLQMAQAVIDAVGEADAACFVRVCEKFVGAGLRF